MSLEFHPIAALFPLIEGEDLETLADDIAANGLHHAITLHEEQVLDGRNRYRACLLRGVAPRYQAFDPSWGSPTAWVISENARRRHLTSGQLATIAQESKRFFEVEMRQRQRDGARMTNAALGRGSEETLLSKRTEASEKHTARQLAARAVGVAETQVQRAGAVQRQAPDLFEKVKAGEMSLGRARREMETRGVVPRTLPRNSHSNGAAPVRIARPVPQVVAEQTAELSPSVRRVIEEFSTDLAIDLSMEFPALILPEWEQVCGKLRARLVRLLGAYSLAQRKEMIR